jgi:hypothetical protein
MKKGRLINIWIIRSVRKSRVTKLERQFSVTCSRTSLVDANHSGCSEAGCLWNPPIETGEGAVESRDKNELVDSLFFVPVLTER